MLGPEYNAADLEAWSTSIDPIHRTPGFRADGRPQPPYTLEENLSGLYQHHDHHRRPRGHLRPWFAAAWPIRIRYDA